MHHGVPRRRLRHLPGAPVLPTHPSEAPRVILAPPHRGVLRAPSSAGHRRMAACCSSASASRATPPARSTPAAPRSRAPTAPPRPTSWRARSPPTLTDASPIVFHTEDGKITDDENRAVVEESPEGARRGAANVATVANPFDEDSATVSQDGRTAYANVMPIDRARRPLGRGGARRSTTPPTEPAEGTGVQVEAGGQLGQKISKPEAKTSELVGIAVAMLILVLVFGTVTAMALPIAVAIFGPDLRPEPRVAASAMSSTCRTWRRRSRR